MRRLERREYRAGQVVVREGEPGTELFIIVRGSATDGCGPPADATRA
jgi:CRP-like cAMP-binding protein